MARRPVALWVVSLSSLRPFGPKCSRDRRDGVVTEIASRTPDGRRGARDNEKKGRRRQEKKDKKKDDDGTP